MLRDKNLVPLSRQHQHALALCVRLERAMKEPDDLAAWQAEIEQQFAQEIRVHFAAEEAHLFPAAEHIPGLQPLVADLREAHNALREMFSRAASRTLDAAGLLHFAKSLAAHVRKEERQLFEEMQRQMSGPELAALGAALEKALAEAATACALPNPAASRSSR